MFIGHFGIGFAAKKFAPGISLGLLFIAAQFLDLLWPTLLLFDLEHVVISPGITVTTPLDFTDYPISHSLLLVLGWALLLAIICSFIFKNIKYAVIIFLCVLSHWFLDLLVHRPDLPLSPLGTDKYGFGLWNYPILTAILEGFFLIGGVLVYHNTTKSKNKFGSYGLLALVILFILIQVANMFGPPPPNVSAIMWTAQLQWIFVILAFYIDKNRVVTKN